MPSRAVDTLEKIAISCGIINAENALQLYRSPLPFIYEIKGCGEVSIQGRDYWLSSFERYSHTSEDYKLLMNNQVFTFYDNTFGNAYDLVAKEDSWYGWNLTYHQQLNESVHVI